MSDLIDFNKHFLNQYVTRQEYREDIEPIREKVQELSESHILTVSLVKTISEDLKKVADNTKVLNDSYKEWLTLKKFAVYLISTCCGLSIILFSVDYSGWLRVINRYLNG